MSAATCAVPIGDLLTPIIDGGTRVDALAVEIIREVHYTNRPSAWGGAPTLVTPPGSAAAFDASASLASVCLPEVGRSDVVIGVALSARPKVLGIVKAGLVVEMGIAVVAVPIYVERGSG